jgi:hypothetical protein
MGARPFIVEACRYEGPFFYSVRHPACTRGDEVDDLEKCGLAVLMIFSCYSIAPQAQGDNAQFESQYF